MPAAATPTPGARLRALMDQGTVVAPFVWDGGMAAYAAAAGHPAVYMTGFGTAAQHGLPDIGLLGMGEMLANARRIAAAVDVPLIADADTGYGNAANVTRTVESYEAAGVAALHMEDQVWPKRCGFMAGKEVIPLEDAVQKVRAACAAGGDIVIIARTDALAPRGWDEVAQRIHAFADAGADLVFVDGLKTREDIERAAEIAPDLPRLLNSGLMQADEAQALGYRLVLSLDTIHALFGAIRDVYEELARTGCIDVEARNAPDVDEIASVLGVERYRAAEVAAAAPSR